MDQSRGRPEQERRSLSAILQRTGGNMNSNTNTSMNSVQQSAIGNSNMSGQLHAPAPLRPVVYSTNNSFSQISGGTNNNSVRQTSGAFQVRAASDAQPPPPPPAVMMPVFKRKRGRPRKYGPVVDGNMAALALAAQAAAAAAAANNNNNVASSSGRTVLPSSSISSPAALQKRGRGRPPGSGKKQQLAALGPAGVSFAPHVITIAAGEDVAMRIMSFCQQGPRAICILSANGAVSNATLRQPASSGGTVTYEGRFDILSLSGSFLPSENSGMSSRTGGLSVSLAGPDGRVVGGGVAGLLMAACQVQVVVGSFLSSGKKSKPMLNRDGQGSNIDISPAPSTTNIAHSQGQNSPITQFTSITNDSSSFEHARNHNVMFQSIHWPNSQTLLDGQRTTDINVSLPGG